jgi:hypothetical protein
MKGNFYRKLKIVGLVTFLMTNIAVFLFNLGFYRPAMAFEKDLIKNFITFAFIDNNSPVTTPINVRLSLWRLGDPEPDEFDASGNLVSADENYGGWQQVLNFTPAADGTVGINLFNTEMFPSFPEIYSNSAFLQVEFKYPNEPNSAYRIVDMLRDNPDNIKRYLLVNSLTSLDPVVIQGGTTNNDFTLDVNFNAPQFIKLIFGNSGKNLTYDLLSNWFNLNGRLNINNFEGIKLAINADPNDNETQLLSIRNSSGTAVFYVDEDGDLVADSIVLPAGSGNTAPILKHLSLAVGNLISSQIGAGSCGTYGTITINGATTGNTVLAAPTPVSGGIESTDLSWNAYVSTDNTILIRACNLSSSNVNTPDTQTWRIDVWGH